MEKKQASIKQFIVRELTAEEAISIVGAGARHLNQNPNLIPQPTRTDSDKK